MSVLGHSTQPRPGLGSGLSTSAPRIMSGSSAGLLQPVSGATLYRLEMQRRNNLSDDAKATNKKAAAAGPRTTNVAAAASGTGEGRRGRGGGTVGCRELDDMVLCGRGDLEGGCVVGISAEEMDFGMLVSRASLPLRHLFVRLWLLKLTTVCASTEFESC